MSYAVMHTTKFNQVSMEKNKIFISQLIECLKGNMGVEWKWIFITTLPLCIKKKKRYYMEFHKNSLKHISFLLIPSKFEEIRKLADTRERHDMDSIHLPPFKLPNKRMKNIL